MDSTEITLEDVLLLFSSINNLNNRGKSKPKKKLEILLRINRGNITISCSSCPFYPSLIME